MSNSGHEDPEMGTHNTSINAAKANATHIPNYEPPRQLGGFSLEQMLGRGGMGAVYLAKEIKTGRVAAVKVMDPNFKAEPSFVERFQTEVRAISSLHHPNIVEVYGAGEDSGWHYLACEYIDGGTVASLLLQMRELPSALAGEILAQLLSGLAHAHAKGVIHRDLKPENLLLTSGGILKVADFGIARTADAQNLTRTGMLVGTAGYMSPEQAKGSKIDSRSDLFQAGIILYEMLAGTNPYASDNPATSITRILASAAPPIFQVKPTAPAELEIMLDKLLAFAPDGRFPTAQAALDALMPFVANRRQSQPTLLAESLRHPAELKELLDSQAAIALVNEVRGLVEGTVVDKNRAAVKLHLATQLDPGNTEASSLLNYLAQQMPLVFGDSTNPKISELHAALEQQPNTPAVILQLAQLYKLEGNLLKAAAFLKQYLKLRPTDGYAANQLFQLTGEKAVQPGKLGPETSAMVAGVRTGGFKAAPPSRPGNRPSSPNLGAAIDQPLSNLTELPMRNPLIGQLTKIGVVAFIILSIVGVVKYLGHRIDASTAENARLASQLRKEHDQQEASDLLRQTEQELKVREEASIQKAQVDLDAAVKLQNDGKLDEALAAFQNLIQKYPKRPAAGTARYQKGMVLLVLNRNTEAIEAFTGFLDVNPAHADAASALFRRAEAYKKNLAFEDAEKDLTLFTERHPTHAFINQVYALRGEVRSLRKNIAGATSDLNFVLAHEDKTSELAIRVQKMLDGLKGS